MKKIILLLVVALLTFTACQNDDTAMKIVDGQDELAYKLGSKEVFKAGFTDAEWSELALKYEASKFQTKGVTTNPPDDLEWEGHYVVPTGFGYVGEGTQMNAYWSPSTREIWGMTFTSDWEPTLDGGVIWTTSGTNFHKLIADSTYWGYWLYSGNWRPVQL